MSDKIKIGPHLFDILYLSKALHEDGSSVLGQCDIDYNKIEIQAGLPTSKQAETEIHEILHGLFAQTNISTEEEEEKIVQALAPMLTLFAQDNPDWLRSWIGRCAPLP